MKRLPLVLALSALLASAAGAQNKVGVVSETGIGVGGAPLGAGSVGTGLSLEPAAMSVPTLGASFVPTYAPTALETKTAPAASVSAVQPLSPTALLPTAGKAVVPAASKAAAKGGALVPTALKPAAESVELGDEKPGSVSAGLKANALFDGSAARAASVEDPGPVGNTAGAPELKPTDSELAQAYSLAAPKGKTLAATGSRDLVPAAADIVQKYTFMGGHFLEQIRGNPRAIIEAAQELVALHDDRGDVAARRFMTLLGRWIAYNDHAQSKAMAIMRRGRSVPHVPPALPGETEYWDMAAGMNAQGYIDREIDATTHYSFFDYSPMVVEYLRTAARLRGRGNVSVVEGDIGALPKPVKPIGVLRTKNAVNYVPGFAAKLEEMVDWIQPGGRLIIQNDPNPGQRGAIREKHGPLIRRLLEQGWAIEYGWAGYPGKWGDYGFDTLVLTKPKSPSERTDAGKPWRDYVAAMKRVDDDYNPFGSLGFFFR